MKKIFFEPVVDIFDLTDECVLTNSVTGDQNVDHRAWVG